MIKIYTNDTTTSKNVVNTPKDSTLRSILDYSKALEVLPSKVNATKNQCKIEVILN